MKLKHLLFACLFVCTLASAQTQPYILASSVASCNGQPITFTMVTPPTWEDKTYSWRVLTSAQVDVTEPSNTSASYTQGFGFVSGDYAAFSVRCTVNYKIGGVPQPASITPMATSYSKTTLATPGFNTINNLPCIQFPNAGLLQLNLATNTTYPAFLLNFVIEFEVDGQPFSLGPPYIYAANQAMPIFPLAIFPPCGTTRIRVKTVAYSALAPCNPASNFSDWFPVQRILGTSATPPLQ